MSFLHEAVTVLYSGFTIISYYKRDWIGFFVNFAFVIIFAYLVNYERGLTWKQKADMK